MSCRYCDTEARLLKDVPAKIEKTPGAQNFDNINNPLAEEQLLEIIRNLNKPKNIHQAVALTGGEPLLQIDFLKNFLPKINDFNLLAYLETNGTLSDRLAEIIDWVDIVAMDFKSPSATGLDSYLEEHRKFLEIASKREVFVKIVITQETKASEIDEAAELIAAQKTTIPLVLQPVTPHGIIKHRPSAEHILALQAVAKRRLDNVRVIPQTNKLLGML